MSRLEIRWPDAATERVRAAQGRLVRAAPALRARSLHERIAAVARVLEDWTRPDSPWRRELIESFAGANGFSRGTIEEGLESALGAWRPDDFVAAAEQELASVLPGPDARTPARALAPFEWTAVLAGGTIPMPTLLSSLLPLVLGSPVLLRETAKDPVTGTLLARSLAARDSVLARAFEAIEIPSDDEEAFTSLLEAPCITATGSDETMRALAARLRPDQRFVAYGHRISVAVVGPHGEAERIAIAHGVALDVARWDQTGCLSPVVALLVGLDGASQVAFAQAVARALDALAAPMPRGELPVSLRALHATERAEAKMRAASGRGLCLEARDAVVVLEVDCTPRAHPLHRFLRLLPVESIERTEAALASLGATLSNVALAGFDAAARMSLERILAEHGASRITTPGRLQTPPVDWPRDGLPLLTPLARFVSIPDGSA